jgi:hypothetical protein
MVILRIRATIVVMVLKAGLKGDASIIGAAGVVFYKEGMLRFK